MTQPHETRTEGAADTCNHMVGTSIVEYYPDVLYADDDGDGSDEHSFSAFKYCPKCGKEVSVEAQIVADRITSKWNEFWRQYGERHGEEEMRRARKL